MYALHSRKLKKNIAQQNCTIDSIEWSTCTENINNKKIVNLTNAQILTHVDKYLCIFKLNNAAAQHYFNIARFRWIIVIIINRCVCAYTRIFIRKHFLKKYTCCLLGCFQRSKHFLRFFLIYCIRMSNVFQCGSNFYICAAPIASVVAILKRTEIAAPEHQQQQQIRKMWHEHEQ